MQHQSSASAVAASPVQPAAPIAPRARFARRALLGAALLGVLADPMLRNEPWGLGLLVWMFGFAVLVVSLVRQSGRAVATESALWLVSALCFAGALSWHDAEPLLVFDVFGMLLSLGLLALSLNAVPVTGLIAARVRDLIRAAFGTGVDVATGIVPLLFRETEFRADSESPGSGSAGRLVKALLITIPIVFVFTLLLTQADPIFGSFFVIPNFRLDEFLSHFLIAGFFTWIVSGWLRRALFTNPDPNRDAPIAFPFTLGTTDVTVALGALNLLFAAFVMVQIGWLFGGESLVLRTTGLSYAAYARRGFFELMAVAALLLPVLLAAQALIPAAEERTLRLYRRLAVPLVVLLGAMMLSAGARMQLYVHYYGISADRLYATAVMIWLAVVFVWLTLTVLRARPRTFAVGLMGSGFVTLLALNLLDPDAFVARSNIARGESGATGAAGTDLKYLATLGGDAVPMVVTAVTADPTVASPRVSNDRCTAARLLLKKWTGKRQTDREVSWTQWNAARVQAARAVRERESALQQLACADTATTAAPPTAPTP